MSDKVKVIGAGLAGVEAAWQLSKAGIGVELYEMKPKKYSPAHKYKGFAELVCSNSLKADRVDSAAGMLKEEMRKLGSLTMLAAQASRVSAGGALAVDRTQFSDLITEKIKNQPNITVVEEEVTSIPDGDVIIATGPLTSDALAEDIGRLCGEYLYFHDAAAPIVTYESLDKDKVFFASRYGKGEADYINCPMNKDEYLRFYNELINAESAELKEFDKQHFAKDGFKVYEGCMPVEVLAKRGEDTMRFGPLKPVGLTDPHTGSRPYAVVQLRAENTAGTLYNLVGFQTNLKFGEQKRVFSMIPALHDAEYVKYGVMHRNTFINSPELLDDTYNLKGTNTFFAGQISGVEGYVESISSGFVAALNACSLYNKENGKDTNILKQNVNKIETAILNGEKVIFDTSTIIGALANYISTEHEDFQPMNANFGLFNTEEVFKSKKDKYDFYVNRAIENIKSMVE